MYINFFPNIFPNRKNGMATAAPDEIIMSGFSFINIFKAKNVFFIRFGIISLLDYYIIDEYVDEVINILNNISHDGYYVKMGVAWCLCEIGIKYNKKFMKYMKSKDNKLDKYTYDKALQKMIESYRIDDCQKDILRQMKRKDK